ncbi:MAG TPA: hypothetical protein VKV74_15985 [Bryobacteraceae bacterium]|nr:hypothetical protein [Bryobacteraceae bacterium]
MRWRYFIGACLLVGWLVAAMGAPLAAGAAGFALAAAWNFYKLRTAARPFGRQTKP